jgi:hypothetical protein
VFGTLAIIAQSSWRVDKTGAGLKSQADKKTAGALLSWLPVFTFLKPLILV